MRILRDLIQIKIFRMPVFVYALLFPVFTIIPSGVYQAGKQGLSSSDAAKEVLIINGETRSLESFRISLFTLKPGETRKLSAVKPGSDEMFIVREGEAQLFWPGKSVTITAGSVIVIPQETSISIKAGSAKSFTTYRFSFVTGVIPVKSFDPYICIWDTVKFTPSANGGRRNIINQPLSAIKNLEIHVTTLKEGLPSHASHTHTDEEILLMRKGTAEEKINGQLFSAPEGSAIYISGDEDHGIRNAGKGECEYYAIRWITGKTPVQKLNQQVK